MLPNFFPYPLIDLLVFDHVVDKVCDEEGRGLSGRTDKIHALVHYHTIVVFEKVIVEKHCQEVI